MSNKKLRAKQKELLRIYKKTRKLLNPFLVENEIIEGTYVEVYQRCGRSGCHCEEEPTHLTSRISQWIDGKLKHKVVRIPDRQWVKGLSALYKEHKHSMAQLTKMTIKEKEIMKDIIKLKKKRYE